MEQRCSGEMGLKLPYVVLWGCGPTAGTGKLFKADVNLCFSLPQDTGRRSVTWEGREAHLLRFSPVVLSGVG